MFDGRNLLAKNLETELSGRTEFDNISYNLVN